MLSKLRLDTNLTPKLLILLALLSSIITLNIILPAKASPAEIRVINSSTGETNFEFYSNTTLQGTRFNATLYVYDIIDLYSFQACLKYNSSLLDAARAWIPEDDTEYVFQDKNAIPTGPFFYYDDPNYGTSVLVGSTLLGDISGFKGTGLLAIVEFEIIDEPHVGEAISSDLNISNDKTFLLDSQLADIEITKTSGFYEYKWAAPLTYLVARPQVYNASRLESFNVTIWLNNTSSLQSLTYIKFKLSYDATLLNITRIIMGNFLSQFGNATFNYTVETGIVTVEHYLNQPYADFPQGDGEIATINFQGIYQDNIERRSSLKFIDTQALNATGGTISVIPMNGAYEIAKITSSITIDVHSNDWVKRDDKYIMTEGTNVRINGTVTPVKAGMNVTIYCIAATKSKALGSDLTDINGSYEFAWAPNQTELGSFYIISTAVQTIPIEFQSRWEGTNHEPIAESDVWSYLEIYAGAKTQITLTVDPKTVVVGKNVTVRGSIEEFEIKSHDPVNVTIYYKLANQSNGWIELATVQTDSKGRYSYQWPTPRIETYKLKASWPGDLPVYEADESDEMTLEVVETAPIDVMAYLPYIVGAIVIFSIIAVLYFKKLRKA